MTTVVFLVGEEIVVCMPMNLWRAVIIDDVSVSLIAAFVSMYFAIKS